MSRPRPRRWVFLVYSLETVGPPIYLSHLLDWIAAHDDVELHVVALSDGPVAARLRRVAQVTVVPDPHAPGARDALAHLADVDLICVHTVATAELLAALPPTDAPVVTHAHEMAVGLSFHLPPATRSLVLERTDRWIAASAAVADALTATLGVDPDRIEVHHEMVRPVTAPPEARAALREELGVAEDALLVGCVAVLGWRKGPDLFVSLAEALHRLAPDLDVHLVWIGGAAEDGDLDLFLAERDAAGLTATVHHLPERPDPWSEMAALDVFALTAREDAYPLACLEAASLGVPIVCFDAGGMREFVEPGGGAVVPYPDVDRLAAATVGLLRDPRARARAGQTVATRVAERHHPDVAAERVHASLRRWERRP